MASHPTVGGGDRPNGNLIQKAAEGGKMFVDQYYPDLHSGRAALARYYAPTANISWNGNVYSGGPAFAQFMQSLPSTHFEVQDYDAQPIILNQQATAAATAGQQTAAATAAECNKVLLQVSGYVKFGDEKSAPARGFSESIILAPDPGMSSNLLVEHQSFRIVV